LIIVALIPLALRGIRYRPLGAAAVLRRNLWIYGFGGIIIPFIGIKIIDVIIPRDRARVMRPLKPGETIMNLIKQDLPRGSDYGRADGVARSCISGL
jgi:hypothetical protein